MSRAPGLCTPLRDGIALRQHVKLLIDIFHVKIFFHPVAYGGLEIFLYLVLDDEGDLAKARPVGVKKGEVDDRVAMAVHGGDLLQSPKAAAHSGGKDNKRWFLQNKTPRYLSFSEALYQAPPFLYIENHTSKGKKSRYL